MVFAATASKRGVLADMDKAAIDVAKALVRLSEVTIFELRGEWRRLPPLRPPIRAARRLKPGAGPRRPAEPRRGQTRADEPGPPSAARSTPENRPTRASSRNSI